MATCINAQAFSIFEYDFKFKPHSELHSYISHKLEIGKHNFARDVLNSEIWKLEENRYKNIDTLTSNRYTQKELDIIADGILEHVFRREFRF